MDAPERIKLNDDGEIISGGGGIDPESMDKEKIITLEVCNEKFYINKIEALKIAYDLLGMVYYHECFRDK